MQISFFVFFHLLQPKSTGQDVFNRVAELLGIKELHFFGLTMVKGEPTASLHPTHTPQPLILWRGTTISLEMSSLVTKTLEFGLPQRRDPLQHFFCSFCSASFSSPQHIEMPQWSFVAPHLNKQPFVFVGVGPAIT